jgi:agmatine/peptidylarginine deiminase/tetratricopeptide (TPR) repeat protein
VKSSTRIAFCAFLIVLCVASMLVYRQLQANTQSVKQANLEKRYLEGQLDEQRYRRQIAEVARFEQIFGNTRLYFQQPGLSIDRVTLYTIFDFAPVLEECAAISGHGDWEAMSLKAAASENLARVSCLQNRIGHAERQLRAALADYNSLKSAGHDTIAGSAKRRTSIRISVVQSRLGWVLSALGQHEEAAHFWRESVEALSLASDASRPDVALELAMATRNLGLTELAMLDSGDELLEKSLEVSRNLSMRLREAAITELNVNSVTAFAVTTEFHIDTCQLLHARFWQRGEFAKSHAIAQESLELLQQLYATVENTLSQRPWQRYQKAEKTAKANLAAMLAEQSQATSQRTTRPLPISWHWQPLHSVPGEVIFQEYLTRGHMHAEFEPHEGLIVSWTDGDWGSQAIVQIVAAASRRMRVFVLVADDVYEEAARQAFLESGITLDQVTFWRVDSGTQWIRDFGPYVLQTSPGRFSCLDNFYVNGERSREDFVPRPVADRLGMLTIPSNFHLMGGELITNGAGLCVASSSVLENNRAESMRDTETASRLKRLTGTEVVVFLDPLIGEPTKHVDWFATFTSPDTIVIGDFRELDVENAAILNGHAERLSKVQTRFGPLKVVRIPMPPRSEEFFGGTYTNVAFLNGVLLVPTWKDAPRELEEEAMRTYKRLLPNWEIVGIDCSQLGVRNGGLHCATINLYSTKPVASDLAGTD